MGSTAGDGKPLALPLGRHQMVGALRRLLLATADDKPVLLIVDDAHCADDASAEALVQLAASGPPVFVLFACRPALPDLLRGHVARTLRAGQLESWKALSCARWRTTKQRCWPCAPRRRRCPRRPPTPSRRARRDSRLPWPNSRAHGHPATTTGWPGSTRPCSRGSWWWRTAATGSGTRWCSRRWSTASRRTSACRCIGRSRRGSSPQAPQPD